MQKNNDEKKKKTVDNNKASTNNDKKIKKKRKGKKKKKFKVLKTIFFLILIAVIVVGLFVAKWALDVIDKAPEIDPSNILSSLNQSSEILDQNGNIIQQIQSANENREIVSYDLIPQNVKDAFVATEDRRFYDHPGIDVRRLAGALINNIKSGDIKGQGGSTITQQLIKNLYLYNQKAWERKIQEMYLAVKIEKMIEKDEILNYYLNTIPMGPSIYGVQAASYAYFSKDVSELTLAESALLAGVPKSTTAYSPYQRCALENLEGIAEEDIVGYVYVGSVKYACIYNQTAIDRMHTVLYGMLTTEKITQEEYDEALAQDMRKSIHPGETRVKDIESDNFTDYVMNSVVEDLMEQKEMTYEEARAYLYKGGLKIYATMDIQMQRTVESIFDNFGTLLMGKEPSEDEPVGQNWKYFRWIGGSGYGSLDRDLNCLNNSGYPLYFKKDNILNDENKLYLLNDEYKFDENGNLIISSKKLGLHTTTIDIIDCYTINNANELVVHNIGGLNVGDSFEVLSSKAGVGDVKINKDFLEKYKDFYTIDAEGKMIISDNYYYYTESGIVQPQAATVVLDYRTGQIKALVGGRKVEGSRTFNRAVDSVRQPGSTIKPLAVYMPAFELGDGPATIVDDVPNYDDRGKRWPKNWMEYYHSYQYKYHGLTTMRYALEQSLNVCSVKTLEKVGIDAAIKTLAKCGLIDLEHPENDTFIMNTENAAYNDMNPSALALGGLTQGFSPLKMAAAYGTIANAGLYVEPICYTKVLDADGNVLLENKVNPERAFSAESSFMIGDILRTTVTDGLSYTARIRDNDIDMAAKTGTTQDNGDLWCLGYSPYYSCAVWVGNDNPTLKMGTGSTGTSRILGEIMTEVHRNLEPAEFEKPDTVIKVRVCEDSGKLPTELCEHDPRGSRVHYEYFVKGTEPTEKCDTHVKIKVCAETFKLPGAYCPDDVIIDRIFIKRDRPYNYLENPNSKTGNMEGIIEARLIYENIKNDFANGMSFEELKIKYDASAILELELVESTDEMMMEWKEFESTYQNTEKPSNDNSNQVDEPIDDNSNSNLTDNNENQENNMLDNNSNDSNSNDGSNTTVENPVQYKYYFEKLKIVSVNGVSEDHLLYDGLECEDYQYQVPTQYCTFHRRPPIKKIDYTVNDSNMENTENTENTNTNTTENSENAGE